MSKFEKLTTAPTLESLKKWNIWFGAISLLEAMAILLLSASKSFPISMSYLTTDSLQSTTSGSLVLTPATHHLFDLNMAYLIAAPLLLLAAAHLSKATWYRTRHEADLVGGISRLRWVAGALVAGMMLVAIAVLCGMYDLVSLILVFVLAATASLLGLFMELHNTLTKSAGVNWAGFVVGCIVAAAAWLAVLAYLVAANVFGGGHIPAYVYVIFGSLVLLAGLIGGSLYLQYKKLGPWKDYLYAERMYMVIGIVAASALAWQIFAGALRP